MARNNNYHHGDLRNTLISTAITMLKENDSFEISLRQLAKRAGVSYGAPYRHFRDKNELLGAIVADAHQHLAQRLERLKQQHLNEPLKQLTETAVAYVSLAVESPQITRLMFAGTLQPGHSPSSENHSSESSFRVFLDIVENGVKHGLYKDSDTQMTALAIWSIIHGLVMLILGRQLNLDISSSMKIQIISRMLIDMLEKGIIVQHN
ncbi:MAG: TetR/AcrR family transcriptional regulator [Gammaproteobacteria bacterium]|nr:TetR/AcrR family transcriptional regulator [Gammaproteobacteria bacterium]